LIAGGISDIAQVQDHRFIPFLLGTIDNKASLSLQNFSRKLLSILAHKIKPGMVAVGMVADGDQLSDVGS